MRLIFAFIISSAICLGLFFGMHLMTSSNNTKLKDTAPTKHLVFLREKNESQVQKKKRVKPKEPIKKPPVKKIKVVKTNIRPKVNQNVKIKPFKALTKDINISKISSLSGAQVELAPQGFLDANSLQALKKVSPIFPRRAKIKKLSGYVELIFDIAKDGSVQNVKILKQNPGTTFEKASLKAIKRWRFKPKDATQNVTITFNFRLHS